MSDQSKPALYALTPSAHATVMAALACYADRVGDAFVENGYEDVATNGGTLPLLNEKQISELAASLNNPGLEFSAIVPLFAEPSEESPYVRAAQENQKDGEFEIDDPAVVSRGDSNGAYVMGWMWVSDDDAGLSTSWTLQLEAPIPERGFVIGGKYPEERIFYFGEEDEFRKAEELAKKIGLGYAKDIASKLPEDEEFVDSFDEFKEYIVQRSAR